MYVTQELHIGGTVVLAFVFHKEMVKPLLQLISLANYCQL